MAGQCCDNCMYSVFDPQLWRRSLWMREPIVPRCANHPQWPGQLHDVPGAPCRNYRPKPALPQGDGVRLIPLGDGFYAYVAAADYDWLSRHTWHLHGGYATRSQGDKSILMHREIMQAPEGMVVDHFDGNKTNNCRLNLRVCTPGENRRNQRKRHGSCSKFKGVLYDKRRHKWFARCRVDGQIYWLGYFEDEAEAARAYDRKAVELFGEFARLNFPKEWPPERRAEVYAQRDAVKAEDGAKKQARSRKAKGKNKKPRAEAQGRRDRRRTTKRSPQKAQSKARLSRRKGIRTGRQR